MTMTISMVSSGQGSGAALDPLVVMVSRSATEDALLRDWVAERWTGAIVVPADAATVRAQLLPDDRLVIPVKVTWVPAAQHEGRARLADTVALPARRSPWRVLQPVLRHRRPGGAVVVEGDAASAVDLRRAFDAEAAGGGDDDLADFVVRRAVLACERAERRMTGDRYKVPRLIVEQITAGAPYRERAARLASLLGIDDAWFLEQARRCLTEIVAVQSPPAIDTFRALTSPMHSRTWTVDVDATGIERLCELGKNASLVFLPSHRSYADPLVLAEVLHRNDFPRNHVHGGANMSFWPLGPFGRRAGIVFIRRTFGDDAVYKFAFREYLGHLMAKRFPIEWYIEGGRTRTGKLRRPRFGVLRCLVDALGQEPCTDAVLVPVSIIYDQLHEVGAVVAEQSGGGKRAEGLRWLARYLRDQRRHIGAARVRFGEPFSLRAALAEAGPGPAQLEKVAFRVCARVNAGRLLDSCRTIVAPRAVQSIVEAQLVVAEQLLLLEPDALVDQQEFLASCLAVGRQMQLQGRLKRPDAVSRELFDGALRLAANRRLVGASDTGPDPIRRRRRRDFRAEVAGVLDLLDRGERRDAALLQEVFHGDDRST